MKKVTEYRYSPEKSARLKKERGIDFQDVITLIAMGRVMGTKEHPNKERYPHQYILKSKPEDISISFLSLWKERSVFSRRFIQAALRRNDMGESDEKSQEESRKD